MKQLAKKWKKLFLLKRKNASSLPTISGKGTCVKEVKLLAGRITRTVGKFH